jgi:putative N-acetyltransferase (TIGR04045 family)
MNSPIQTFTESGGTRIRKSGDYLFKIAESKEELDEYFRLRHAVFVEEQKIFSGTDVDERDRGAIHIIALKGPDGVMVGGVRCYTAGGGTWYGGRLTAASGYRNGRVGSGLVRFAVETVKSRGCREFLAYVQPRNVNFFKRLDWKPVGEPVEYEGITHQLMEADLGSA